MDSSDGGHKFLVFAILALVCMSCLGTSDYGHRLLFTAMSFLGIDSRYGCTGSQIGLALEFDDVCSNVLELSSLS